MTLHFKNLYPSLLVLIFLYIPIETIMNGTQINILPPSYIFILLSAILIFIIYLISINDLMDSIKRNLIATIIFIIMLLHIFTSAASDYLGHISQKDFMIYNIYIISYFLIGLYLALKINNILNYLDKNKVKITFIISIFFIIFLILLIISNDNNMGMIMYGFGNKIKHAGIHLIISSMIAILAIFQMSKAKNIYFIILWFLIGLISEFILGSRSALVFYVIASMFLVFFNNKKNIIFIIAFLFLSVSIYIDEISLILENQQRFASLLSMDMNDESFVKRAEQLTKNYIFIENNYLTGLLMSENLVMGKGTYIHSYLSYLQSYGITLFLIMNFWIIHITYKFYKYTNINNDHNIFMFATYIYVLLEFIFARGYGAYHLFMFLMIFNGYIYNLKYKGITIEK